MDYDEFSRRLKEQQNNLFNAVVAYDVYIELLPTEETVEALNAHKGVFVPILASLYTAMSLGFARAFDANNRTMSLHNLLEEAKKNSCLVPYISADDLDAIDVELANHTYTVNSLKQERDQYIAHMDANPKDLPRPNKGEYESLIDTLGKVFNRLHRGHDKSIWDWEFQRRDSKRDTEYLIQLVVNNL